MKIKIWIVFGLLTVLGISSVFAQSETGDPAQTPEPMPTEAGTPIMLQGWVLDSENMPIAGARIQIWQADADGSYFDAATSGTNATAEISTGDFQYFGSTLSRMDGYYAFLTLVPGTNENEPPQIYFTVTVNDVQVLSSRFAFAAGQSDAASPSEAIVLELSTGMDMDGNSVNIATGNIMFDMAAMDLTMPPTPDPAATEAPFYPAVELADYDNNLLSTGVDDDMVMPILMENEAAEADTTPEAALPDHLPATTTS